jgi:cytochrome oxidase Cu insertion factor (SCO1/SenC/PrrC family)
LKRRLEDRQGRETRAEALRQALDAQAEELAAARAEAAALAENAGQVEWIKEKSAQVILKQQKKLQAAVTAYTECRQACQELQAAVAEWERRFADSEEEARRLTVSYEQERQAASVARSEAERLRETIKKMETELATERKMAALFENRMKQMRELNQFHARAAHFDPVSPTPAPAPEAKKVVSGLRSIPAEFLRRDGELERA